VTDELPAEAMLALLALCIGARAVLASAIARRLPARPTPAMVAGVLWASTDVVLVLMLRRFT